jgi:hypothetical protein
MEGRDLISGEIQSAVSKVLGDSAAAGMRQAAIFASRRLWPDLLSVKSPDEAGETMSSAIAALGSWISFSLEAGSDGVMKITFKDRHFVPLTADSEKGCGERPICHFGFGFVEETLGRLTGIHAKAELLGTGRGNRRPFRDSNTKTKKHSR